MVATADATALLTADDVAKIVGLKQHTIRKKANAGEIGHVRVSRKSLRFTPQQVSEWIARRSVGSSTPEKPDDKAPQQEPQSKCVKIFALPAER